jgi:hypothetical protein
MISKSDELIDIMEDQKTRSTAKDSFPFGYESESKGFVDDLEEYVSVMGKVRREIPEVFEDIKNTKKEILKDRAEIKKLRQEEQTEEIKEQIKELQEDIENSVDYLKRLRIEKDKEIVAQVKQVANTNMSDSKILTTFRTNYSKWKEWDTKRRESQGTGKLIDTRMEGPTLERILTIVPYPAFRVALERTYNKPIYSQYSSRDYNRLERTKLYTQRGELKEEDKNKLIRLLMINEDKKELKPKDIQRYWKKITTGSIEGLEFSNDKIKEKIMEIANKYKRTTITSDKRKLIMRMNNKSSQITKTVSRVKYKGIGIGGIAGIDKNLKILDDRENDKPLYTKGVKREKDNTFVSLKHYEDVGNTHIEDWLKIAGYKKYMEGVDVKSEIDDFIYSKLEGTELQYIEGTNYEDYYDDIYANSNIFRQAVDNNVSSNWQEVLRDKRLSKQLAEEIYEDMDNRLNLPFVEIGRLINLRPEISDTELKNNVEAILDGEVAGKTYGFYILMAIIEKVGYRRIIQEPRDTGSTYLEQDLRTFENVQSTSEPRQMTPKELEERTERQLPPSPEKTPEDVNKSIGELDEDERRRVKTYLQNAHPTEYFGEDYLKLGKLINILDEVEGNTGELEGLSEENLKVVKLAASLRKRYENLYRKLREKIYPEDEEE